MQGCTTYAREVDMTYIRHDCIHPHVLQIHFPQSSSNNVSRYSIKRCFKIVKIGFVSTCVWVSVSEHQNNKRLNSLSLL